MCQIPWMWVSLKRRNETIRKLEIGNGKQQVSLQCLIVVLAALLASKGISEGAN